MDLYAHSIQSGSELSALKSAGDAINYAEVNTQEVYKGCGLLPELDAFLPLRVSNAS
jgi:hypothetical protein